VLRSCAIALGILIMVAALAVGGFAVTKAVRGQLDSSSAPKPTSSALARATVAPGALPQATAGEVPTPAAVAAALKSLVASPSLGGRLRADIVDVQSGTALYQHSATAAAAPASTAKLLTAAAVLSARGATYRITTEARTDDAGTLYLIGAGDPTLSGARAGAPTASPWPFGVMAHAALPSWWIDRSLIVGEVPHSGHLGSRRSRTSRNRIPSAS